LIGEKIKRLIRQKGYTVTEFAEMINCSRRTLYEIFRKNSIDTELLYRISLVLGYNLFDELSDKTKNDIGKYEQKYAHNYYSFHNLFENEKKTSILEDDSPILHFKNIQEENKFPFFEKPEKRQRKRKPIYPDKESFESKLLEQMEKINNNLENIVELINSLKK